MLVAEGRFKLGCCDPSSQALPSFLLRWEARRHSGPPSPKDEGKGKPGKRPWSLGGGTLSHPPLLAHCHCTRRLLFNQDWAAASQDARPRPCPHSRLGVHIPPRPHTSSQIMGPSKTTTLPTLLHQGRKGTPSCLRLPAAHPATREPQGPVQAPGPARIWSPICLAVWAPPAPAPHASH